MVRYQSILKEINPRCPLEGLRLKLKLQYFGHIMWRVDSLEKTLMLGGLGAGGEGDNRGWDGWMASLTQWPWVWVNSGSWWWTGRPGMLWFMGSQSQTRLSDWNELNWTEANTLLSLFYLCVVIYSFHPQYLVYCCQQFRKVCRYGFTMKLMKFKFQYPLGRTLVKSHSHQSLQNLQFLTTIDLDNCLYPLWLPFHTTFLRDTGVSLGILGYLAEGKLDLVHLIWV